jgi:hypothetical protein
MEITEKKKRELDECKGGRKKVEITKKRSVGVKEIE